jgi:hypothetical protein
MESELAASRDQSLEIQAARPAIDFVIDQRDRYTYAGLRTLAKHLEDVSIREPGNGGNDFAVRQLQAMHDHLMDI